MSVLPKSMTIELPPKEREVIINEDEFCEYAYDFERNQLKLRNGRHYYVYGNEAMKIWIFKAIISARYRYSAYSDRFGSEVFDLIGEVISSKLKEAEVKRYITEAIMVHPLMKSIRNIDISRYKAGLFVVVDYSTIFNDEVVRVECQVPIE